MHSLLALLFPFFIAGCSTTPITFDTAKKVPEYHIYNDKYVGHEEGKETVYFIRGKGFEGSLCAHVIFIDNDKVCAIRPGEAIATSLTPGNHFFRLNLGIGLCPNESYSQSTYLAIGEPQTFRISTSQNKNVMLTRIE